MRYANQPASQKFQKSRNATTPSDNRFPSLQTLRSPSANRARRCRKIFSADLRVSACGRMLAVSERDATSPLEMEFLWECFAGINSVVCDWSVMGDMRGA